ncbi:MAG: SMC-Scp complex subunit ScpB [Chloroflexi bacterium]|nr:MAG: SMC-Scp complex subunit ScpB [Chloroflexota bacterium]
MRGPPRSGDHVRGAPRADPALRRAGEAEGTLRTHPRRAAGAGHLSDVSAALEAILFSSNRPLKVRELQQAIDSDRNSVEGALEKLRESLEGRGVMLMRHHDEIHLATRPEYAQAVRRALRPEVSGRLSQAAYETLAIVAYQQPVSRARVEEVRGVNCESVLGNLELRDLITEVGRGSGPGQPKLYGTTMRFLQVMGLESLEHLPTPSSDTEVPQRANG